MGQTLETVAASCVAVAMRRAARATTNFSNALLRGLDLNAAQFGLLAAVGRAPGQSLAALADDLTLDDSTLTRNLTVLERRGLIARRGLPGRGGKQVALTAEGRRLLDDALPVWAWANDQVTAGLSEEELAMGRRFLDAVERAADASRQRFEALSPEERVALKLRICENAGRADISQAAPARAEPIGEAV
jgi:DNA-binding MarR family transcriptional regulator